MPAPRHRPCTWVSESPAAAKGRPACSHLLRSWHHLFPRDDCPTGRLPLGPCEGLPQSLPHGIVELPKHLPVLADSRLDRRHVEMYTHQSEGSTSSCVYLTRTVASSVSLHCSSGYADPAWKQFFHLWYQRLECWGCPEIDVPVRQELWATCLHGLSCIEECKNGNPQRELS